MSFVLGLLGIFIVLGLHLTIQKLNDILKELRLMETCMHREERRQMAKR